uniref:hypothetical protein n=1 Tax=Stutzerimonas nitrititolerans TaxID=2482751 RepID=UPI002899DF44
MLIYISKFRFLACFLPSRALARKIVEQALKGFAHLPCTLGGLQPLQPNAWTRTVRAFYYLKFASEVPPLMLDSNLKTQLKAYLEKVTQPFE